MGRLSTHVLDTVSGRPASGVRVELWRLRPEAGTTPIVTAMTNADGRTDGPLLTGEDFQPGEYELVFDLGAYFQARGVETADPPFLDRVPIRFSMAEPEGHYHVPLLASPWSYSTYRGS
jgi:5-hydroxyisourate hydrolase